MHLCNFSVIRNIDSVLLTNRRDIRWWQYLTETVLWHIFLSIYWNTDNGLFTKRTIFKCQNFKEQYISDTIDANEHILSTHMPSSRLIPHCTKHASLTQSPRGWWRKLVDCCHRSSRCCATSLCLVAASHQSSSKQSSARCWRRAGWIVVQWRTTSLFRYCAESTSDWIVQFLRPRQHSIGYMGDGFYRSKDPTNSIKVLKEMLQKRKQTTKTTKYT